MNASTRDVFIAWFALLIVDLAIVSGGFPRVHRLVRGIAVRSRATTDTDVVQKINNAVDRAAVWYPRVLQCLPRSVAATWLLRRRGIAAAMVIGIRKIPFYAHAWVEVDGQVVNDSPKVQALYPAIDRLAPRGAVR